MPSGYTSKIYDNKPQTFEEFALACARNFGALISMRDSSLDAEIPETLNTSQYHSEELAKDVAERSRIEAMTPSEADEAAAVVHARAVVSHDKCVSEARALRARYESMRRQAEAWAPPTDEHAGLRNFMIEQLTESIRWDCSEGDPPKKLTGQEWRQAQLASLDRDIGYHDREQSAENRRTESRNAWLRQLRESLRNVR